MSGIVVVGAGIVGASITYHLARAGAPVMLLEQADSPASGVTGSSFAWIGEDNGEWPGGAQDLRDTVLNDWRRLEADVPGVRVRWTGSLSWRSREGLMEPDLHLRNGQSWIGRHEIASFEPNLQTIPERALFTRTDAGMDPLATTTALVRAAEALGAEVRLGIGGVSLAISNGSVIGVTSSKGTYVASRVVLAAGTGVNELCTPLDGRLPVKTSAAFLVEVGAPAGLVRTILDTPEFEARESRAGHILMTAPHLNDHLSHSPLEQLAEETVQHLRSAFSEAGRVTLVGHRIGWRPMPAAGPIVGYLTPDRRASVAVMHSGVTLAATVGRLVADELTSGRMPEALRRIRPPRTRSREAPRAPRLYTE